MNRIPWLKLRAAKDRWASASCRCGSRADSLPGVARATPTGRSQNERSAPRHQARDPSYSATTRSCSSCGHEYSPDKSGVLDHGERCQLATDTKGISRRSHLEADSKPDCPLLPQGFCTTASMWCWFRAQRRAVALLSALRSPSSAMQPSLHPEAYLPYNAKTTEFLQDTKMYHPGMSASSPACYQTWLPPRKIASAHGWTCGQTRHEVLRRQEESSSLPTFPFW
jgi:hypothetical protein